MELKKEVNQTLNLQRIDSIIRDYNKENLVPSSKAWELWFSNFFNRINLNRNDVNFIKRIKIFRDSNSFEETDFKNIFPELKFGGQYINPMSFELYNISKKEIEIVAFKLSEEIEFIEFSQLRQIVEYTFRGKEWNYKGFFNCSGIVSKKLKRALLDQEIFSNFRKVS